MRLGRSIGVRSERHFSKFGPGRVGDGTVGDGRVGDGRVGVGRVMDRPQVLAIAGVALRHRSVGEDDGSGET